MTASDVVTGGDDLHAWQMIIRPMFPRSWGHFLIDLVAGGSASPDAKEEIKIFLAEEEMTTRIPGPSPHVPGTSWLRSPLSL
jgi:hypothetical protein